VPIRLGEKHSLSTVERTIRCPRFRPCMVELAAWHTVWSRMKPLRVCRVKSQQQRITRAASTHVQCCIHLTCRAATL
jgi:hypothetical protein